MQLPRTSLYASLQTLQPCATQPCATLPRQISGPQYSEQAHHALCGIPAEAAERQRQRSRATYDGIYVHIIQPPTLRFRHSSHFFASKSDELPFLRHPSLFEQLGAFSVEGRMRHGLNPRTTGKSTKSQTLPVISDRLPNVLDRLPNIWIICQLLLDLLDRLPKYFRPFTKYLNRLPTFWISFANFCSYRLSTFHLLLFSNGG